jgi:hypothetical protein
MDLHSLFVYDIQQAQLREFRPEGLGYTDFFELKGSKGWILTRFAKDINGNGKFEAAHEPLVFKKLDTNNWLLVDFITTNP